MPKKIRHPLSVHTSPEVARARFLQLAAQVGIDFRVLELMGDLLEAEFKEMHRLGQQIYTRRPIVNLDAWVQKTREIARTLNATIDTVLREKDQVKKRRTRRRSRSDSEVGLQSASLH